MRTRPTHNDLLDGIKENIESTNRQIAQLRQELHSLAVNHLTEKRQPILQKLTTLQENLHLLKERWKHAVNPAHSLEHPVANPEGQNQKE
ncbi:MAG: hypothetical protein NVS2B7_18470 [Herpetosiphon sp.]